MSKKHPNQCTIRFKKDVDKRIIDFASMQENFSDTVLYLIEKEIAANGMRNLQEHIPGVRNILPPLECDVEKKEQPRKEESKPVVEQPRKEESKPVVEQPRKEESKPVVEQPSKEEDKPVVEQPSKEEDKPMVGQLGFENNEDQEEIEDDKEIEIPSAYSDW
ncbi:hypothetical protein [Clostridium sp.]|uniref:hypothetical protein n=1 Tax=Clostridium sp. TaxID=1506 RepID=UPI003F2B7623